MVTELAFILKGCRRKHSISPGLNRRMPKKGDVTDYFINESSIKYSSCEDMYGIRMDELEERSLRGLQRKPLENFSRPRLSKL